LALTNESVTPVIMVEAGAAMEASAAAVEAVAPAVDMMALTAASVVEEVASAVEASAATVSEMEAAVVSPGVADHSLPPISSTLKKWRAMLCRGWAVC